jgi:hypothetical protein
MPAQSTVVDLTGDDGDDESPSRRDKPLQRPNCDDRKQLRKLLPRPAPGDERARMLRKYAPELCTPTRVRSAPVSSPLPHAHPPKTPGVEAYTSLLSQYLSGRDSPDHNGEDNSPTRNPLTPTRPQQQSQRSTSPNINKAASTISYFTPAAHSMHSHPYFAPPPEANSKHASLFSEHGLSTQRSVIDPRLLEGAFTAPPPPLKLSEPAAQPIATSPSIRIPVLKEAATGSPPEAQEYRIDNLIFADPETDLPIDEDSEQFTFADDHDPDDIQMHKGDFLGNHEQGVQDEPNPAPTRDGSIQGHSINKVVDQVDRAEDKESFAFYEEALDVGQPTTPDADGHKLFNDDLKPAMVEDDEEVDDKTYVFSPIAPEISMHDSGFFDGPADPAKVDSEIENSVEDSGDDLDDDLPEATPPPHSWDALLAMAFETNGTAKSMNVKDICKAIEERFPYYKNNTSAWKDGVQACLNDKPEFVKVSRSRPLWVFKKDWQRTEFEKTVQIQNDDLAPGPEQPAGLEATTPSGTDAFVDEPVRLITVRSLRERPPKPEQNQRVKKRLGRPRKASGKNDEEDAKEHVSAVQEQTTLISTSADVDELAPSPDKLAALRTSISLVSAPSTLPPLNDFERLHTPVLHHHNTAINKNMHGQPQASTTQSKSFVTTNTLDSSVIASSSPLRSLKTPGTVYSTADTPDTSYSNLFGLGRPLHRGVAALRSSIAPEFARSRSSSVALPNSRKRVVYTPVREVEGDEDELG